MKKILLSILFTIGIGVALPLFLLIEFYPDIFTGPKIEEIPGIITILVGFPFLGNFLVRTVQRNMAKKQWDPFFKSLQFHASNYLSGRQYHGEWMATHWDIYVHSTQRSRIPSVMQIPHYNGHMMELIVEAPSKSLWAVYKLAGQEQQVRSKDETWSANFLKKDPVKKAIGELLNMDSKDALCSVQGIPNALRLSIRTDLNALTADRIKIAMTALQKLAAQVAKEPLPTKPIEENLFWRWSRKSRSLINLLTLIGCLGIVTVPILMAVYFLFINK